MLLSLVEACDFDSNEGEDCSGGMPPPQDVYYFDKTSKFCEPLKYKGCGGNKNRFATMADCESFCVIQGAARPSPS